MPIDLPSDYDKKRIIAAGFSLKLSVDFENYAGCVDELLVWIRNPRKHMLENFKLEFIKFFCNWGGGIFGLNMQAMCDHMRQILDINISHRTVTSDNLAFLEHL